MQSEENMTDIVTRLLALADTLNGALPMEPRQLAQAVIREAAAEIKRLQRDLKGTENARDQYADWNSEARAEVRALKAKLADAEKRHQGLFDAAADAQERAENAEAEAAALREAALTWFKLLEDSATWKEAEKAEKFFESLLSQPAPGAAYQEHMKLLEALHAAVIEEEAALDAYDNHEPGSIPRHVRSHSALKACLAALEETP